MEDDDVWDHMSFAQKPDKGDFHVDYIDQDMPGPPSMEHGQSFILEESHGLTQAGVQRVNDSIRTYVWAILEAQTQIRTSIMGTATAFDAQKQFLANIEGAISSPVDLPSAIKRYEVILRYARSKVDYVFGIGLYIAPSNMELRIGHILGYNNEIVIATGKQRLGVKR